jgi:hypothetical protein
MRHPVSFLQISYACELFNSPLTMTLMLNGDAVGSKDVKKWESKGWKIKI